MDNPAPKEVQNIKIGEASQPPASSSATSDTSVVVDEVRQAIHVELLKNFLTLGINPEVQKNKAPAHSIIGLVTPSGTSPAFS